MKLARQLLGYALAYVLLGAGGAWAKPMVGQSGSTWAENASTNYESRQRFAFEIKFSPYTPHIDQSKGLNGQTPFADLFNPQVADNSNKGQQPPYRLLTLVEFDYQFLHRKWGNLGIGHQVGFYKRTTHSFTYPTVDPSMPPTGATGTTTACAVPNCVRSGDETSLNIMPFVLLFVYRFDLIANKYHIPFVPYIKLGLGYYVWWMEDGNGIGKTPTFTTAGGQEFKGYGGTFGFTLQPGLAFQLDVIDRRAARVLDTDLGINHSYIFCELNYANINGFGADNKLNLSDIMLNAGMAFEF